MNHNKSCVSILHHQHIHLIVVAVLRLTYDNSTAPLQLPTEYQPDVFDRIFLLPYHDHKPW